MIFTVHLASAKPVYLQLVDQVKLAVASGRLQPGDRLPPIRDVAAQVRVNRNTVARVYADLEREGVVYTRAGQGCFVSDRGSSLSRTEQTRQLTTRIDDVIAQGSLFGLSREDLSGLFARRLETILGDAAPPNATQNPPTKGAPRK